MLHTHPKIRPNVERSTLGLHPLQTYQPLIGDEAVKRILHKAAQLRTMRIAHVSSTFYGGGVSEILTPLTLMMNASGIETDWHLIQGTPAFFGVTKKLHNALQGDEIELSDEEKAIYEQVVLENATRIHLEDCDAVIVHDPQPLPLIQHFATRQAQWLWQCHVDLSNPCDSTWAYLSRFLGRYGAAIFSLPEYAKRMAVDQRFITPAIDPFAPKNAELSPDEIRRILSRHRIPVDRPLVTQISRFDRWKDPIGVIDAFRRARKQVPCRLVLLGNSASDDPESEVVLKTVRSTIDEHVIVLTVDDPLLVNALQRHSAVVLQKFIREGFGLTVTEAMWKGAAVIGGNVGGIRHQIRDGENGFLVNSIDEAAERIVQVLRDPTLRARLGADAKETVRERFLMSGLLENWLDLLANCRRPARV
jgi:trehalose synthase